MKLISNRFKSHGLTVALAASVLLGYAASVVKPAKFVLAVQSAKADDLGKQIRIPIALMTVGQAETVAALANSKTEVVWFSNGVAVNTVVDANTKAFALHFNFNGTKGYRSVILTNVDKIVKTLDEALTPGKHRYAAGTKTSTLGYVLPQHFLFTPRKNTAEAMFKSVDVHGHFSNLNVLWAK